MVYTGDGTILAPSIPIPILIPLTVVRFSSRFDSDAKELEKGSILIPIPISESELSHLWFTPIAQCKGSIVAYHFFWTSVSGTGRLSNSLY